MTTCKFQGILVIIAVTAAAFFSACAGQTSTTSGIVNQATNTNSAAANQSSPPLSISSSPSISNINSAPNAVNTATTGGKTTASTATMPQPKIGTGGSDFSLVTSARAALSADKELLNGVVVDVKEGSATLNGKVSSEAQKKKAEELVRGVQGIKNVTSNLSVAP